MGLAHRRWVVENDKSWTEEGTRASVARQHSFAIILYEKTGLLNPKSSEYDVLVFRNDDNLYM